MSTEQSKAEVRRHFARRLNHALDLYGIAPKHHGRSIEVAKMFGLTQRNAARWINGEVYPPKSRRQEIADRLKVSHDWLSFNRGETRVEDNLKNPIKKLPVLSFEQAKDHELMLQNFGGRYLSIETQAKKELGAFMLSISDTDQPTIYPGGSFAVIDPSVPIYDGASILAVIGQKKTHAKLCEYMVGDNNHFVIPHDGDALRVDDNVSIVGIVRDAQIVMA